MSAFGATAPTDQRAGIKPIAFVLKTNDGFQSPVLLNIRPEELTRTEPSRATVNQTMGRDVAGWVDDFGEGLPQVTLAGQTGWRANATTNLDGAAAFEALNSLVAHQYHEAKQNAIDVGLDPDEVKLIFIDMLDNFTYSVVPSQFVLRRSRSRPLLFQYNIALQTIDTRVDNPLVDTPDTGDLFSGLSALERAVSTIEGYANKINSMIATAVKYKNAVLAPIGKAIATFVNLSSRVFHAVTSVITSAENAVTSTANTLIGYAADIAKVGVNLNRTISAIAGLPDSIKYDINRVASAFNEVYCIFKNSLKKKKRYNNYNDLFGASNCSSTTGGTAASLYASTNSFSAIQYASSPVMLTSGAQASLTALGAADPVLAPMSIQEIDRHVQTINNGTTLSA